MKVVIDTNTLISLLDPRTSKAMRVRLDALLDQIQNARGELIIPAQIIAEYLVEAGSAGDVILNRLLSNRYVILAPFDHKAAIECAELDKSAKTKGASTKKWPLPKDRPWQKIKIDRQIVAIAKAQNAHMVISEDTDLLRIAFAAGLKAQRASELPIPESAKQMHIEDLPPTPPSLRVTGSGRVLRLRPPLAKPPGSP